MNTVATSNPKQAPETTRFLEWFAQEKRNGLIDVKFCPADVEHATVELFFAEANRAIAAETVNDPELV